MSWGALQVESKGWCPQGNPKTRKKGTLTNVSVVAIKERVKPKKRQCLMTI